MIPDSSCPGLISESSAAKYGFGHPTLRAFSICSFQMEEEKRGGGGGKGALVLQLLQSVLT